MRGTGSSHATGLFCPFSGATVGLLELLTHCGQKDAEDSGGALVYSR